MSKGPKQKLRLDLILPLLPATVFELHTALPAWPRDRIARFLSSAYARKQLVVIKVRREFYAGSTRNVRVYGRNTGFVPPPSAKAARKQAIAALAAIRWLNEGTTARTEKATA